MEGNKDSKRGFFDPLEEDEDIYEGMLDLTRGIFDSSEGMFDSDQVTYTLWLSQESLTISWS